MTFRRDPTHGFAIDCLEECLLPVVSAPHVSDSLFHKLVLVIDGDLILRIQQRRFAGMDQV